MDDGVEADLATTTHGSVEEQVHDVHGDRLTRIGKPGRKINQDVEFGFINNLQRTSLIPQLGQIFPEGKDILPPNHSQLLG